VETRFGLEASQLYIFKDHSAPKVGVQVMPKGGVLGLERFYERSYACIGGKK